jgi:hypothetical protein
MAIVVTSLIPYTAKPQRAGGTKMSPESSQVRSRYLALALDARKVIDALIVFVDKGERQRDLNQSLKEAIFSLKAVKEKKEIFSPQRNRLAFSEYYEQVRTVDEALKPTEREQSRQARR